MDLKNFDKRIVNRNLKKGIVSQKEYQTYLEDLPDLQDSLEVINIQVGEQDEENRDDAGTSDGSPDNDDQSPVSAEIPQVGSKELDL